MACYACEFNGKLKKAKMDTYRYTESGLDNVILCRIPALKCPECGVLVPEIPHPLQLHEVIARAIISKKHLLTPAEVRFLRSQLGYSQKDFAPLVHRNASVFNRIERGKEKISEDLDRLVRMIFLKEKGTPKRVYQEMENLVSEKNEGRQAYRFRVRKDDWEPERKAA